MKTILFGDKRPGMIEVQAQILSRLDTFDAIYERGLDERGPLMAEWERVKHDVQILKGETVGQKERKTVWGSVAAAVVLAVASLITSVFGGPPAPAP